MWFMEEPSQFSVGQAAQNLTCSIMENPLTGLDDCLNMLLSCSSEEISGQETEELTVTMPELARATSSIKAL